MVSTQPNSPAVYSQIVDQKGFQMSMVELAVETTHPRHDTAICHHDHTALSQAIVRQRNCLREVR